MPLRRLLHSVDAAVRARSGAECRAARFIQPAVEQELSDLVLVYGQSSGPLSAAGLTVTLQGVELTETGENSFEFGRSEHVTAVLGNGDASMLTDWAFGGLIGELGGLLPGVAGVLVSCNGGEPNPPVVNDETGHFPATATYVAYDYAPSGETGQIIVTVFVGDKWYQSTFQVHVVTKDSGHDGATARSVGVAALAGIAAVLLMG